MSLILRQSTSKAVSFGPFLDKTDGVTLEVGLVTAIDHATTGIFLSKNGGALAIRSQAVTASTYDAYGNYIVTLSTTDTNTIGTLRMQFSEAATCLPVWQDFVVVDELVYDALFGTVALATTTNITAGTITTVTNLTNLPATGALEATLTAMKGATFSGATDSLEAIRDRGDAAWITATGFALASVCTEARLAELDAANLPATTDAILTDTGTTLDGLVTTIDTVVDAIKVQTDKMTFTVANQIDANTESLNATALVGDGSATPWGPL